MATVTLADGRVLPVIHGGSPITTNANLNRDAAERAHRGGMTAEQIAAEWPEVWRMVEGKLSQRYDYALADGSGRYETNRLITRESVIKAIRKYARKGRS